jgi:hypothetical protein
MNKETVVTEVEFIEIIIKIRKKRVIEAFKDKMMIHRPTQGKAIKVGIREDNSILMRKEKLIIELQIFKDQIFHIQEEMIDLSNIKSTLPSIKKKDRQEIKLLKNKQLEIIQG